MNFKKSQSMKISVLPEQEKELSSKERIDPEKDDSLESSFSVLFASRRVILLRSDICLTTSDICFASFMANKISLKPQVSISFSRSENITPTKSEYQ